MKEKIKTVKCFLFDMDGTIYLGGNALPGAAQLLEKITASGKSFYFLTNNSSRGPVYYRKKLEALGINTLEEQIIISTHSLFPYFLEKQVKSVFVLGTDELKQLLRQAGYTVTEAGGQAIDYVVVGYDNQLNYQNLSHACQYLDAGIPYVATHPDVRCPIEEGKYLPDCGSILALLKTATGKECELIAGKPSRYMVQTVLDKTGLHESELVVVGDRLYTDIALGNNSGIMSILVLSGEAEEKDIINSTYKPDVVLKGIHQLSELI